MSGTTEQIMMTLAQFGAISSTERPSGESVEQQEQRILNGINGQLANTALPTGGEWQAVWIGLTQDRANLAYIAQNTSQNAFAVSLRGTQFNSLIDLSEDLNVGAVAEFTVATGATESLLVSLGSMKAFTEVISATYVPNRTTLLQALIMLIENAPESPTLYITGHSLGGAMATMVALYLSAQTWSNQPAFAVYTFAAPTAGLQAFASYFDLVFPDNSWRYYNVWDLVPNAWVVTQNVNYGLSYVQETFYPSIASSVPIPILAPGQSIGPAQNIAVHQLIGNFINAPGANVYVQTNQTNGATPLNNSQLYGNSGTYDPTYVTPSTPDFLGQVSFQHNSYLAFLGVSPDVLDTLLPPPTVAATGGAAVVPITPNSGSSAGGTAVTITGSNFTPDSVVDFGTVPAAMVTIDSETQITAISPPGVGTVDVRVTNMFGTSAVTPADQFTAPSPVLAPVVTAITPDCGPVSGASSEGPYTVTITGAGFTSDCGVFFGSTQIDAEDVVIVSLTEITVTTTFTGTGSVPVTVTTTGSPGIASTPTFTFGPPVVTSISPTFGVYGKNADNPAVKITGFGFGTAQGTVNFGGEPATTINSWSDTAISVNPPIYKVVIDNPQTFVSQTVDVTVTNSASQSSATVPVDEYIYYNSSLLYS